MHSGLAPITEAVLLGNLALSTLWQRRPTGTSQRHDNSFHESRPRAAADGQVSLQELIGLRQQGWGDGAFHRDEAEALFALNNALVERDEAWVDFFVEAIGEFVLNGTQPRLQCSADERTG